LVKWLSRENGYATESLFLPTERFEIAPDNVITLLRLSDKFEIQYLLNEIKVSHSRRDLSFFICRFQMLMMGYQIFAAHWITLINAPTYELWELAAQYELEYLERHCRSAARVKANNILMKGEGLGYFLSGNTPSYMVDRMIRALFAARESVIPTDYKGVKVQYL
jgi:hypothetical protein